VARSEEKLVMWTIYDHPTDFPHCFVARKFTIGPLGEVLATSEVMVASDIEKLRSVLIKRGLVRMTRAPDDDPKIVETWL
jgi:hypothetical protein